MARKYDGCSGQGRNNDKTVGETLIKCYRESAHTFCEVSTLEQLTETSLMHAFSMGQKQAESEVCVCNCRAKSLQAPKRCGSLGRTGEERRIGTLSLN